MPFVSMFASPLLFPIPISLIVANLLFFCCTTTLGALAQHDLGLWNSNYVSFSSLFPTTALRGMGNIRNITGDAGQNAFDLVFANNTQPDQTLSAVFYNGDSARSRTGTVFPMQLPTTHYSTNFKMYESGKGYHTIGYSFHDDGFCKQLECRFGECKNRI
jgi:hypothetical protein